MTYHGGMTGPNRDRVLAALDGEKRWWTSSQLRDALDLNLSVINTALGGLYAQRKAEREVLDGSIGPGSRYRWRAA